MITLKQAIQIGQEKLAIINNSSLREANFEAQLLLQHVLDVNHAWLISHALDTLQNNLLEAFEVLLKRRLNGEPIAYILGYREFFGLKLAVSPDTLIPRPDTETLVEAALDKIPLVIQPNDKLMAHHDCGVKNHDEVVPKAGNERDLLAPAHRCLNEGYRAECLSVLDLGTGSGAIALAIAKNRPNVQVTALDASQAALVIAIENAKYLNIKNVYFELSHWFSALNNQRFDVIVSNPPYIEDNDIHLSQGDLRYEPLSALASGADGLDDIRQIIRDAPQYIAKNGWLMLEHGYNQAENVALLLANNGFSQISHVKDLVGIMRVTIGRYVAD